MAQRFDRGELRPARKRADGTARYDGYLTRSGVFKYLRADGSVLLEYRSPEEVFKAESLATLELVPITNNHPTDMIDAANAARLAIGAVGDTIQRDGDKVRAAISVLDTNAIELIDRGKTQISCGYTCTLILDEGVSPEGEPYHARQTDIEYNHVALVDRGRAGPEIRIRSDAAEQVDDADQPKKETDMELKEALEAAAKANARADQSDAALTVAKASADKLAGELDATKVQLAAAEQAKKQALDSINGRVATRVALESRARAVLTDAKFDGLSDRQIQCAVIKQLHKADVTDDRSDDYVAGRFEAAIAVVSNDHIVEDLQKNVTKDHQKTTLTGEAAAYAAMVEANKNAYKGKI